MGVEKKSAEFRKELRQALGRRKELADDREIKTQVVRETAKSGDAMIFVGSNQDGQRIRNIRNSLG